MGRGDLPALRSLPRLFLPGLDLELERWELPPNELKKLRNVLRLQSGAQIAVLPGDGSILRCTLEGHDAVLLQSEGLAPRAPREVTLALGLPKPEKLDEVVRMATEMGVAKFVLFHSDRTVVKWTAEKFEQRLRRLRVISQEAAEVCFRGMLPEFETVKNLDAALKSHPQAVVLSEVEGVSVPAADCLAGLEPVTLVIGPEGGWSPREVALIGNRAATLGPLVMRVDTAAACACSLALCQ